MYNCSNDQGKVTLVVLNSPTPRFLAPLSADSAPRANGTQHPCHPIQALVSRALSVPRPIQRIE